MSVRQVLMLSVITLAGCRTPSVDLPLCPDDLGLAERDLSGDLPFDPASNVYRTEEGELCRTY